MVRLYRGLQGEPFTVHPLVLKNDRLAVLILVHGGFRKLTKANITITLLTGEASHLGDIMVRV
jgi:hypothetical protein